MVCAALQAAEKMMKRTMESRYTGFRPKMSLNFANMTMTATSSSRQ